MPDAVLEYLEETNGLLSMVDRGQLSLRELKQDVEKVLAVAGAVVQPPEPPERMRPERGPTQGQQPTQGKVPYHIALSQALFGEAKNEEALWAFRQEHLSNRRLQPGEVKPWVLRQAEADGPPSRILRGVVLPDGVGVKLVDGQYRLEKPVRIEMAPLVDTLPLFFYENGLGGRVVGVPVRIGGVLDKLLRLSLALETKFGWLPEQAATFVLTDLVPSHDPIRSLFNSMSPYSALMKIILAVNPAVTPKELADEYASIRALVVGPRHRNLSDKHRLLAGFIATQPEEQPWRARMEEWNEYYARGKGRVVHDPAWEYKDEKVFIRDARAAYKRLLHPQFRPISQPLPRPDRYMEHRFRTVEAKASEALGGNDGQKGKRRR